MARYHIARLVLYVASALMIDSCLLAAQEMGDPLFGIMYDPQKVHFENAPTSLRERCSALWGRDLWLYAEFKTGETEYFVLSGLLQIHPDGPATRPASSEPDGGIVAEIRGTTCKLTVPDVFMWEQIASAPELKPLDVTDAILNGLVSDALRRYEAAFGGKSNFLDAVRMAGLPPAQLPPVLRTKYLQYATRQ
jgi:hypothetical protein